MCDFFAGGSGVKLVARFVSSFVLLLFSVVIFLKY